MATFLTSRLSRHLPSLLRSSTLRAAAYSTGVRAKKWVLIKQFDGFPKHTDFELHEETLPPLQEGEYLCQAEWISVDPYQRAYMINYQVPVPMIGLQVARVLESRAPSIAEGSYVVGGMGWRTHAIRNAERDEAGALPFSTAPMPEMGAISRSHAVGVCGMPGNTAYFGLLELCDPQPGETVVVSGAAGAVGALVGQIAKIRGCRVVGFAGTDAKCDWLKSLGFDAAINYKTCEDIDSALKAAVPKGIDCYFDNVGGLLSHRIRQQMNEFGRVSICGSIASYNDRTGETAQVDVPENQILFKQLKVEGFIVTRWDKEGTWQKGIDQMAAWIREGKIKVQETVTEGFQNMPKAFIGMLKGENTGKAVVKATVE